MARETREGGRRRLSRAGRDGLRALLALGVALLLPAGARAASFLLIPMDSGQPDHLRAYGVVFWALQQGLKVDWLLNHRGGSFLAPDADMLRVRCRLQGVGFEPATGANRAAILQSMEGVNQDVVLLEKNPKIAVYTPPGKDPWDDAVTLVLDYAEVPFDKIWDKDVLGGRIYEYDWVHLHHEDFTGQFGKFYASFHSSTWYQNQVAEFTLAAKEAGYPSVQAHKGAVARAIRDFVEQGGFLFAMCSATDTLDIALAAEGVDIVPEQIDGSPMDPQAQAKLDFGRSLAFQNFTLVDNAYVYEYSDIDVSEYNKNVNHPEREDFVLVEYSAKFDPVESMLTQDHVNEVPGFFGQTTSFKKDVIKPYVRILAEMPGQGRAKYVHGNHGKGFFTFLGGHDPEDFSHAVGDPPTDLSLHKQSPGYRLILNNILFPAARQKKRKT